MATNGCVAWGRVKLVINLKRRPQHPRSPENAAAILRALWGAHEMIMSVCIGYGDQVEVNLAIPERNAPDFYALEKKLTALAIAADV